LEADVALYPPSETDRRIPHDALTGDVARIFQACGMGEGDARLLSWSLVHADLRGIHSHGVLRVPDYVAKLTEQGVDPKGRPRVAVDAGPAIVVDCGNAMGQIGMAFAMEQAIARAGETRMAVAAVRGSNHCGALDFFAMLALQHDMIGLCTTNALPTMAPWGGREKIVGINPLGIAIPGGEEGPFVLDFAFGQTAHGKIRVYAQKGAPISAGWAFDAEGRPTTDAQAALAGLIQPIGGHKGVGLGMAFGMLASLLSGGAYGSELGNMVDGPRAGHDAHLCLVIDPSAFVAIDVFKRRVDAILRQVRTSERADGIDRLYTPGEIERELERDYRDGGIPLNQETLAGIAQAAERLGVSLATM
jgi:LDH2 family malate/lactate/ureidoglycolate dehydrogenase